MTYNEIPPDKRGPIDSIGLIPLHMGPAIREMLDNGLITMNSKNKKLFNTMLAEQEAHAALSPLAQSEVTEHAAPPCPHKIAMWVLAASCMLIMIVDRFLS